MGQWEPTIYLRNYTEYIYISPVFVLCPVCPLFLVLPYKNIYFYIYY